jgi:hypothetical protein
MEAVEITRNVLMYFILPLWLAAGFADYLCHRAADIEQTSGYKESLLHLLQFGEMAVPILAVMFLEVNALIILLMIVSFLLHEATALWDVTYASRTRTITPIEQHIHSFLEMLPLMGLLMVVVLHWTQFTSLFGLAPASFAVRLKEQPLPLAYLVTVLTCVLLFEILPYVEELVRGLRAARRTQASGRVPGDTKSTVMR